MKVKSGMADDPGKCGGCCILRLPRIIITAKDGGTLQMNGIFFTLLIK